LLAAVQLSAAKEVKMNYKQVASSETKLWEAYYNKNQQQMISSLRTYLQELFSISKTEKLDVITNQFVKAYATFGAIPQDAKDADYNAAVLPLLTEAYQTLKSAVNASWAADEAAKLDLDWMISRRRVATLNPEIVAAKMANFYACLFGKNSPNLIRAAYLRAVAARYRDECQDSWGGIKQGDWQVIEHVLEQSYLQLTT
jgi:hypothetical protein